MRHYYCLVLIILICFVARLVAALTVDGYFGVDGGAYLLSRNDVLGWFADITGPGLPRPPLAPGWLLVPFTAWLSDDVGFKLYSALFSLLPIPAVYLLARRFLSPSWALLPAAFIAIDPWQWEIYVTGIQPLIGFSLTLVCMWAIGEIWDEWDFKGIGSFTNIIPSYIPRFCLIACIPLIAYVNQTSVMIAGVYLAVWICVLFANSQHKKAFFTSLAIPLVIGVLIASTALPWYVNQLPGGARTHWPGPWIVPPSYVDMAWFQMIAALVIGAMLWRKGRGAIKALGAVLIASATLVPWLSYDETLINLFYRTRYWIMLPMFIGIAVLLHRTEWFTRNHKTFIAGVACVAVIFMAGDVYVFRTQSDTSMMVSANTAEALEIAKPSDSIVTNAYTMALWVAALNQVPAYWTNTYEPPEETRADDENVRCILGWIDECDVHASVVALRASHVLIDERFPDVTPSSPGNYMAPPDQWQVTASVPWLTLIFSKGTTRLYEINKEAAWSKIY